MIRIGITPAWEEDKAYQYIKRDYVASVIRSGGFPLILPATDDEKLLDEAFELSNGMVFSGGSDVDPALYDEELLPHCGELCPLRDRMETYLMKRALNEGKPFLAICRGFELLNVLLGGTLYQDIATEMSKEIFHPQYDHPSTKVHDMTIVPGTLLHQSTGLDSFMVNSRHHQGVKTVGRGLVVSAKAPDGLVEGLELPGHPLAIAIQWHPESLSDRYPEARAMFDLLLKRASGTKA